MRRRLHRLHPHLRHVTITIPLLFLANHLPQDEQEKGRGHEGRAWLAAADAAADHDHHNSTGRGAWQFPPGCDAIGILAVLQRKKHHFFSRHNVKTLRFKLTVLSVVLTYEILGIFLGCTYVSGEDVVDTSIRLAIILGTIGFTGTLTYVMTTYLETGKIKNIGNK